MIGQVLGNRYELLEKIGEGGMSVVYKARCNKLNRLVAVKVLKSEFCDNEEIVKKFKIEATAIATLSDTNIVNVLDVGTQDNVNYIVMEYVRGKTLKEIITEEGPLGYEDAINKALQIAKALKCAHDNGIIHRDVKPQNILVSENGLVKVTDFGIAKSATSSTMTSTTTVMGSAHYFSPEQAKGEVVDIRTDLYSLGVVMYEMVTGIVPFDADTPVSVALNHMQEDPVPPIELNPHLPEAVNKIILKALKKDPMLRYQTATELLQDLKMALKNPSGDFVEETDYDPTAKTQKISTQDVENMQKNSRKKEDNKFVAFIKEHKVFSVFIGLILLFFIAFGGTMLVLKVTNPKEVEVPNVVGSTREEAQQKIEGAKLKFEVSSEEYSADTEENHVISQDPAYLESYNKVKEGSTVKVVISKGTEKTKVPNVKGKEKDEAVQLIEDAKLKAEIVEETSKTVKEGYVISQETDANTEVNAGDTLKIHLSTGTEKATVPGVVGKSQDEAKKALQDLGFVVTVTNAEDSSKENGAVLKQSLDEGQSVEKGSAITITVNKLAEKKSATIFVNVKSITGGYKEENTTNNDVTTSTSKKKVKLRVEANGETIYNQDVDKNSVKINTGDGKVVGTGTVTVKVFIDDIKEKEKDIDLKTTSSYTFD